jgi:hypothetical protein
LKDDQRRVRSYQHFDADCTVEMFRHCPTVSVAASSGEKRGARLWSQSICQPHSRVRVNVEKIVAIPKGFFFNFIFFPTLKIGEDLEFRQFEYNITPLFISTVHTCKLVLRCLFKITIAHYKIFIAEIRLSFFILFHT